MLRIISSHTGGSKNKFVEKELGEKYSAISVPALGRISYRKRPLRPGGVRTQKGQLKEP